MADRVEQADAHRGYAERVLFAIESEARFADPDEVFQKIGELGERVRRTRVELIADEQLDRAVVQGGEIGLSVRGTVQWKGVAHGRYRTQAMWTDDLVDEQQPILHNDRKINGLTQFSGELDEDGMGDLDDVGARRPRKTQDLRTEDHAAVGGSRYDQLLGLQGGDNTLRSGARETGALGDLAEAQTRVILDECAQDRSRARDDLHLRFVPFGRF